MTYLAINDSLRKKKFKSIFKTDIISVIGVLILFSFVLSVIKRDFATIVNLNVIAKTFSITAIVGLAQMVILATGGMNLAVGAIGGLVAIITGGIMDALGLPMALAIFGGLITGILCGFINGLFIARAGSTGVASFLVTLAMSSVYTGINLGLTKANPFYNLSVNFKAIGELNLLGLPIIFYIMVLVAVLISILLKYLGVGRQILAVGSNMRAAELYGVSVRNTIIIAHMLSGLLAAVAAILLTARIGSAQTDIGSDWMMFSFAAPIIGGTRLSGGKINTLGAVLGAVVLAIISNGLVHLNIGIYWMTLIQGLIIFTAVAADKIRTISLERVRSEL